MGAGLREVGDVDLTGLHQGASFASRPAFRRPATRIARCRLSSSTTSRTASYSVRGEAVLDFAERVALNAARLWLEATLAQRQRLQSLMFPEGLQLAEGEVRTPVTPSFFEDLDRIATPVELLVSPTGFEPVLLP
jgi:hypothetical protein